MQYRSGVRKRRGDGTAKGRPLAQPSHGDHQPKRASISPRSSVAAITPRPSRCSPSFPSPSAHQKLAMPKSRPRRIDRSRCVWKSPTVFSGYKPSHKCFCCSGGLRPALASPQKHDAHRAPLQLAVHSSGLSDRDLDHLGLVLYHLYRISQKPSLSLSLHYRHRSLRHRRDLARVSSPKRKLLTVYLRISAVCAPR